MRANGSPPPDHERTQLIKRLCAVADGLVALPEERLPAALEALREPAEALFLAALVVLDCDVSG